MAYSVIRICSLMLLASVGWAQSFSDPIPDGEWWRATTGPERTAFVKGLRVGMTSGPAYLTRSEKDLEGLITAFYANRSNLQSTITSVFQVPTTRPANTTSSSLGLPPPPPISPSPQPNRDPLAGLGPSSRQNTAGSGPRASDAKFVD
jgi:hypothetical protein